MESAQEILFVSIFAAALVGLAVYFVHLNAVVAWRRVTSPFFRVAIITSCSWFWSLCAAGFVEYCAACARQLRHTHVSQMLREVTGVFLFIALGTFFISFAGFAIGVARSLLRGRRTI
jgi:hypothetical protein